MWAPREEYCDVAGALPESSIKIVKVRATLVSLNTVLQNLESLKFGRFFETQLIQIIIS